LEVNTDKTISVHEEEIDDKDDQPDGGYGWLVVLGAFCVQVTSFGVVSSW
jgi:hypothetical protein